MIDLVKENERLHAELTQALSGRDREYTRAEKERQHANEWLGQLTDAKAAIEAARGLLGAAVGEGLFDAVRRVATLAFYDPTINASVSKVRAQNKLLRIELTRYRSQENARFSSELKCEPGTLADVFTREEKPAKKSTAKKRIKKASK